MDFRSHSLRKRLKKNYGHSLSERFELIKKYIGFIKEENNNGRSVVLSTVSHKQKMRELARNELSNFIEVNLICSANTCSKRDYKNIYNRITEDSKECFPGVTEPYEISKNAELIANSAVTPGRAGNNIAEFNRDNLLTLINDMFERNLILSDSAVI